jgi:hypothetical protein
MGRANVYLPDDLERRVKAAEIPISEVCQRALLAAVEVAEGGGSDFGDRVSGQFERGMAAGRRWAAGATAVERLTLLRDQRFAEIPVGSLPDDLFALSREESLSWEAGFNTGARDAVAANPPTARPPRIAAQSTDAPAADPADDAAGDSTAGPSTGQRPPLGDSADSKIGVTLDGDPVSFDPHAAVRAGKSPMFAVLGEADLRARLTLGIAQDAAARGTAVVLLDLSGQLSPRAKGLGRSVRLIHPQTSMPQLDDLLRGAINIGGLMGTLSSLASGSGLLNLLGRPADDLVEPGYVTVVDLSGDGALTTALTVAQGLSRLLGAAEFPRLVLLDLPATLSLPGGLESRLGRLVRAARDQNAAVGLCAPSADTVAALGGSGALLSSVFAFATSSPAEADRLRDLLGPGAPVLLNPPGATVSPSDQTWVVMRDLEGRVGQVRIEV